MCLPTTPLTGRPRVLLADKLTLTGGINNLLDEEPPLSLRTAGAGHQLGYDPRYTDLWVVPSTLLRATRSNKRII